jgi:SseB protein C-terminal domain
MMGKIEKRIAAEIQFLGEQDGQPERDLKVLLIDSLKREKQVQRAYLARISSGGHKQITVALCVWANADSDHSAIVKVVSDAFASVFHTSQFLDIMFLSDVQEAELRNCCSAFFNRDQLS